MLVKVGSVYAVTNKRVIIKTGVISRRTVELVLAKCEGIQVVQGIAGRIFGYGSIVVTTGGTTNFITIMLPIRSGLKKNKPTNWINVKSGIVVVGFFIILYID